MSATRPCTSGSAGASSARMRPRRSASSHSAGRIQSSPAVAEYPSLKIEVDHLQHRRQPRRQLRAARDLEGDARLGQRPLGAHDALGDGRLGDEEGARDLLGRQAAQQAQRERDPRLGGEDGVAGR